MQINCGNFNILLKCFPQITDEIHFFSTSDNNLSKNLQRKSKDFACDILLSCIKSHDKITWNTGTGQKLEQVTASIYKNKHSYTLSNKCTHKNTQILTKTKWQKQTDPPTHIYSQKQTHTQLRQHCKIIFHLLSGRSSSFRKSHCLISCLNCINFSTPLQINKISSWS